MKKKFVSRVLTLLLAVSMVVGNLPLTVSAEETQIELSSEEQDEQSTEASEEVTEVSTEVSEEATELSTEASEEATEVSEEATELSTEASEETTEVVADVPVAYSTSSEFVSETHTRFKQTTTTIAPGVTQDICFAYANDGEQMAYYIATADITRDDVNVYANYKDNQCTTFGMAKVTEQLASAQAKHSDPEDTENYIQYYNAVAGVNGDFYNMTTGRPSGAFVMEGVLTNGANNRPWFAILEDGTAKIGYNNTDWAEVADQVVEAVGGSVVLVYDGEDVSANAGGDYNTARHSRTCVGITADGKVVMMVLDGRQSPFSCGGTMKELAQIMLEAGCVYAINLDGGGSTTFVAKQEGENDLTIVNRPSDGSERAVSSSLMIVSTAVPSNVFDRAVLSVENEYVTPGSTVTVSAKGVSPAGTAADIPADITWQLENTAMGTVSNGVFTSNGTTGDTAVQMVYDGNVVGEITIHVVVPDAISFDQAEMTVPFGKTVTLAMTAKYGLNEVALKAGDVSFALSDTALGTTSGFDFTASNDSEVTSGTISATLAADTSVTASATLTLGKGSEVIFDFEDGTIGNFYGMDYPSFNYIYPENDTHITTAENGEVHSGTYAMALDLDYSNSYESGYLLTALGSTSTITIENGLTLGMWMYIPEEAVGMRIRICLYDANNKRFTAELEPIGKISTLDTPGWYYVTADISSYPTTKILADKAFIEFYVSDRSSVDTYGYDFTDYSSLNTKLSLYIDDITVDYSSAVDDREAPVFSSVVYADPVMSDAVELKGQTTTYSTLSFTATVSEDTTKNNYTGIDAATAKAYIDGAEVEFEYSNGKIIVENITLADGEHTVKFVISDKMGNVGSVTRSINVDADSDISTIKVVAHDDTLDKILLGSLYYVDVVATDVEKVSEVSLDLDLNNMSVWQLDHMTVADGFAVTYTLEETTNVATLTITRENTTEATGEAVLVSIPIRTWEWGYTTHVYGSNKGKTVTYAQMKSMKEFWPIDISVETDRGAVTFTDGTTGVFSSATVQVDTEMYAMCRDMIATEEGLAYYNEWDCAHEHRSEYGGTPTALDDMDATCTTDGYTGRTFCEECNSVVDWGTTIPATGHTYVVDGDSIKCESCEDIIPTSYTGFVEGKVGRHYVINGKVITGWRAIEGDYYYFRSSTKAAATGKYLYSSWLYTFDNDGKLIKGAWETTENGKKYWFGPSFYQHEWATIDGKEYFFDSNGYPYTGYQYIIASAGVAPQWYHFDEDGALIEKVESTGLFNVDDKTYYLENGISCTGLILAEDGYYYYFVSKDFSAVKGTSYYITNLNDTGYEKGWQDFDEQGRMIIEVIDPSKDGFVEEDGILYYYVEGVKTYAGLIQIGEDYYYVNSSFKVITNQSYWISKTNGLLPNGMYEFDETGKMIIENENPLKDGFVNEDGTLYYYVNGIKTYAGLIQIGEDYYYINSSCKVITNQSYWISKTNDLLPSGMYEFDETGKMIIENENPLKDGFVNEDGTLYYYVNGVKTYAGLIQIGEDYYYVNSSCKVITNQSYWISKTNGLLSSGMYEFDETGKLIN